MYGWKRERSYRLATLPDTGFVELTVVGFCGLRGGAKEEVSCSMIECGLRGGAILVITTEAT